MKKFIKKVLENTYTEEEKLKMLQDVANKKVTPDELADIVKYLKRKQAINIDLTNSIDICWTGWSWLDRINTSTLACLKLAKMWVKIAKHWNNASSGRFGSFDLIEKLWYTIPNSEDEILHEFKNNNIAFLYAKNFFPFMREFAEVRKDYWKPTIFNILWPLLSPANSNYQMIGCSFEDKMELMIETSHILWRKNVIVVRWHDWLDEVTLTWKTKIYELKHWKIKNYDISPNDFWHNKVDINEILEKDIEKKIEIAREIIAWKKVWAYSNLVDINVKVVLDFLLK